MRRSEKALDQYSTGVAVSGEFSKLVAGCWQDEFSVVSWE